MNKSVFRDISINLLATSLCTVILNFIVYPSYARIFSAEDYGNILTVVAVIHLLFAVFGNCLNNTRLVLNKQEKIKNEEGNYNPVLIIVTVLGSCIGIILFSAFQIRSLISSVLIFVTVFFGIARAYYVVYYRLKLDYFSQLKANIIVASGYIIGVLIIKSLDWWPLPLFLGEVSSLFYTLQKGSLKNEPFRFTKSKSIVVSTYVDLILLGVIGNLLAYFDRFLVNPVLGAASVAIFSVAAFWGKSVTPLIAPIANVMLSYLCQKNTTLTVKRYIMLFIATILPLSIFGFLGIWFAPWVTGLLYPTLIQDAIPFIIIASVGSLIHNSTSLLMPVLLSICNSRALLRLQLIYFSLYLVIVFFGAKSSGLMGFSIAVFAVGVIKTILYFCFGFYILKKQRLLND